MESDRIEKSRADDKLVIRSLFQWSDRFWNRALETVDLAWAAGIKFNPDKCQIKKRKITYFGRVISPNGVKPCPKKVQAILRLAAPVNKQELQSFLGAVNFLSTFIPSLSKKTYLTRSLLKKDIHQCMDQCHDEGIWNHQTGHCKCCPTQMEKLSSRLMPPRKA